MFGLLDVILISFLCSVITVGIHTKMTEDCKEVVEKYVKQSVVESCKDE